MKLSKLRIEIMGLIVLGVSGCQSSLVVVVPSPSPTPVSSASPSPIAPSATPSLVENDQKIFQRALNKGYGAASIAQSAQSGEDWRLVQSRWEQAIALLQQIPAHSPHHPLAQQKITQYQQNLTYAQTQAAAAPSFPSPPPVVASKPVVKLTQKPQAFSPTPGLARTPIKRREGGTPVIDVVFNGTHTFEMILDTGATGVVITQPMAQSLQIPIIGEARMDTASAQGVVVPVGLVTSVAVPGVVVENLPVAIAGPQLSIGLLGHDFFADYDLIIRQDLIEFEPRF